MAMPSSLHVQVKVKAHPSGMGKGNHIGGNIQMCCANRAVPNLGSFKAVLHGGSGGGLLEKPTIEKTSLSLTSNFDLRKSWKMPPPYRVLLHNDDYNKCQYVVKVLMKVIPGMTLDSAFTIMLKAHTNGIGLVIICGQPQAEEHCTQLRANGLLSSIEPATGGCYSL